MKRDTQVTQSQLMLEEIWSMGCSNKIVSPGSQQELLLSNIIYIEHYRSSSTVAAVKHRKKKKKKLKQMWGSSWFQHTKCTNLHTPTHTHTYHSTHSTHAYAMSTHG